MWSPTGSEAEDQQPPLLSGGARGGGPSNRLRRSLRPVAAALLPTAALGALLVPPMEDAGDGSGPQARTQGSSRADGRTSVELVDYDELKQQMNAKERDWCPTPGTSIWHMIRRASRASVCDAAYKADAVDANRQATECGPDVCQNGNEQNALQHCLWSGYMTADLGEATARGFLDRHEYGADPNSEDHLNDLANNEIGIGIVRNGAVDAYMAGGPVGWHETVKAKCTEKATANQLVFSPF